MWGSPPVGSQSDGALGADPRKVNVKLTIRFDNSMGIKGRL